VNRFLPCVLLITLVPACHRELPATDGGDAQHADLAGAHLTGADLAGADLGGVDLVGADLRAADLATTTPSDLSGHSDLSAPSDLGGLADLAPSNTCGAGTLKFAVRAATKLSTSSGNLQLNDVSVRPDGEIWVTGSLNGSATFGEGTPHQQTLVGGDDILIARYAADGTFRFARLWVTGYNSFASGTHIRALADGGAMVAASFYDTVKLDDGLASAVTFTAAGGQHDYDIVLARIAADGHVVWARHSGGAGQDTAAALDALPDGRSVLVGRFADAFVHDTTVNRGRADAKTLTIAASQWEDLFLASYDAQGTLSWVRLAGGTSRDDAAGGALLLGDGSVVVSGTFTKDISFEGLTGALPGTQNNYSSFIARWSSGGTIDWAKTTASSRGHALGLGPNGSIWHLVHTGADDAIVRYSQSGTLQGSGTFATSNALHYLSAMAISGSAAYIGGDEYYDITLNTTPPTTVSSLGWQDALALCTNQAGQVGWWRRAASNQHDHIHALSVAPNGEIVAIGQYDADLTFAGGPTLISEALFDESFIARFAP
jgi:hypothetical protein